jgi:hypothetical protein
MWKSKSKVWVVVLNVTFLLTPPKEGRWRDDGRKNGLVNMLMPERLS